MAIAKKSFFGAALGTLIEYYDYTLMFIFLPILAPLFFPANTIYQSLTKGYFMLLIGMLARPLGGWIFGYLGDTLGRRRALLNSLYGIAVATFIVGVLPGYTTWGAWSTFLIILAKSVQMFCFGGEYNGAGIYVVEHAQNKNEALAGSLLTAMTLAGSLAASGLGILLTAEFMPVWSWRIAFILGGLVGLLGIFYRKELAESPGFKSADLKSRSLRHLLKKYPAELTAGFFIGGFSTLPFTTVLAFINPMLMIKDYFTNHQLMISQTLLVLIAIASLVIFGKIADKTSSRKLMQGACLLLIITAYPLLFLIDQHHWAFFAMAMLIIVNEMLLAPSNAYFKNLFAVSYRYRATSLSFCLGMSIIGGLTPIIENYLYHLTGNFQIIFVWLITISVSTLASLQWVYKKSINMAPVDNYEHSASF